jgi:transposase
LVRGLMSDEEWGFFEPFVIDRGPKRGRPPGDHRLVLDGVFWIGRTGAPWRDLPGVFGKWGTVYRQFCRWTQSGVWDVLLESLNESGEGQDSVQMIDSTIIRAHQHAAGAKKKQIRTKVLAARAVASRPRSI